MYSQLIVKPRKHDNLFIKNYFNNTFFDISFSLLGI